jgi:hypothetical protein
MWWWKNYFAVGRMVCTTHDGNLMQFYGNYSLKDLFNFLLVFLHNRYNIPYSTP